MKNFKKVMCGFLTAGLLISNTVSFACAKDQVPSGNGIVLNINGENTDTVNAPLYKEEKITMLPLRLTAEKLGFTVEWNEENQEIKLDNKEVNTIVYIGTDSYYMASSTAIGMSAPTALGAAPVLKNDLTYVPADMFKILLTDPDAVKENGSEVTITSEKTQIPNPFTE